MLIVKGIATLFQEVGGKLRFKNTRAFLLLLSSCVNTTLAVCVLWCVFEHTLLKRIV